VSAPEPCPNWRSLAAARDERAGDPPGWDAALHHLDGCPRCRRTAVEADPMLAFRRLPPLTVAADEVESMRLRVAALRGAAQVAPPSRRGWRFLARHGWAAAAAAAVALFTGAHGGRPPVGEALAAVMASTPPSLVAELAAQPLLEELDQPFDNVVQWDGDDLSVVLVLDERFASSTGG
jgi:hypothetical protein